MLMIPKSKVLNQMAKFGTQGFFMPSLNEGKKSKEEMIVRAAKQDKKQISRSLPRQRSKGI